MPSNAANWGQTISNPAPRNRMDCARTTKCVFGAASRPDHAPQDAAGLALRMPATDCQLRAGSVTFSSFRAFSSTGMPAAVLPCLH